ncbi:uncharacterized protein CPUR_06557 [Claviceps purpurea 20.1]|uniref:Uncharacterized protein n=1 Tax=Claviceps purpurea (strain 20.1) TaxID=1111077 RepID=M1WED3_CLAP2|nr:uncharacterized protein CPUR_06557 [Claviceps purpurea 20.1]
MPNCTGECPTANAEWDKARESRRLPQLPYLLRQPHGQGRKSTTRTRGDTFPRSRPSQEGRKTLGKPQPNAKGADSDSDEAHQSNQRTRPTRPVNSRDAAITSTDRMDPLATGTVATQQL